jgi:hypothetical protein
VGLGYINNNTRIDFSQLSFDQQLSNIGFDRALPAGEPSLSNATSFSSACAGIMYTYDAENSFFNMGIAGYRFVKSNRSILDDKTQYISPRYDIHADFGTALNDNVNLNFSAVHMIQNGTSNTAIGSNALSNLNGGYGAGFYNIGIGANVQTLGINDNYSVQIGQIGNGSNTVSIGTLAGGNQGFYSNALRNSSGTVDPVLTTSGTGSNYVHYNLNSKEVSFIPELYYAINSPMNLSYGEVNQQLTIVNDLTLTSGFHEFTNGGATGGVTTVYALSTYPGSQIIIAGNFTSLGGVAAKNIAGTDQNGSSVSQIGNGLGDPFSNEYVLTTSVDTTGSPTNRIYAGGSFTTDGTGSTSLNYIAYQDTGAWTSLSSNNLNGFVRTISSPNYLGDIYFGGDFSTTPNLNYISKYNKSGNSFLIATTALKFSKALGPLLVNSIVLIPPA